MPTKYTAIADLDALRSLPLDRRRELPNIAAIYFVLQRDAVLYIGKTSMLKGRFANHHLLTQFMERPSCRVAWVQVADASHAAVLERACIALFKPAMNQRMHPDVKMTRQPGRTVASGPKKPRTRKPKPSLVDLLAPLPIVDAASEPVHTFSQLVEVFRSGSNFVDKLLRRRDIPAVLTTDGVLAVRKSDLARFLDAHAASVVAQ